MKTIIFFDTNMIRKQGKYKLDISKFIEEHERIGDVFLIEIVADELAQYYTNTIKTEIFEREKIIQMLDHGFKFRDHFEEDNIFNSVKKTIQNYFGDKQLAFPQIGVEEIYQRALTKKPPFSLKGDNGLKDTLIWLTILHGDYSHYDKIIFLTKDKQFTDHQIELDREFQRKNNKSIQIVKGVDNLLKEIDLDEVLLSESNHDQDNSYKRKTKTDVRKETIENLIEDHIKLGEMRNELQGILYDLCYSENLNPYEGFGPDLNFQTYEVIDIPDLDDFIDNLIKVVRKNNFTNEIDPYALFEKYINLESFETYKYISMSIIVEFLRIINQIHTLFPQYDEAITATIINYVEKETYLQPITGDDLPF